MVFGIAPLILANVNPELVPPWPQSPEIFVAGACTVVILLLFLGIRHFGKEKKRKLGKQMLLVAAISCLIWISSSAILIVEVDSHRVVRGVFLTETASSAISTGKSSDSPADLLRRFGQNSPEIVWKYVSVAKTVIFLSFLITFSALSGCFASLALQDINSRSR